MSLGSEILAITASLAELATPALEHWSEVSPFFEKVVSPLVAAAGLAAYYYKFREVKALRIKLASVQDAVPVEKCSLHDFCIVKDNVSYFRKQGYSGLDDEVRVFVDLRIHNQIHSKSMADYMATAHALRAREERSWHVLYATPNAIEWYVNGPYKGWVEDEAKMIESRARRQRILIITDDASEQYASKARLLCDTLGKTSLLKVVSKSALVENGQSHLLRDFGVFRTQTQVEALLSFGVCGYDDIFSTSPAGDYSTINAEYTNRLIKQFETAWNSQELRYAEERATYLLPPP